MTLNKTASRILSLSFALVLLSQTSSAYSQDRHALTDDGKDVTLHAGGTWEFSPKTEKKSKTKVYFDNEKRFSIELDKDWKKPDHEYGDDAELSFNKDKPYLYGMSVAENIPMSSDDVVHFLTSSFDSTGSIFLDETRIINDRPMRLVGIDVESEGLMMRMHILIHTGDGWYVKFVTWTLKSATDKYSESDILDYFNGIKILKD